LLVIGGGYIGLELGSVYQALGSNVSVVEMLDGLLPGADRDLVSHLSKRLKEKFESIMLNSKVVEMKEVNDGIQVKIQDKKKNHRKLMITF
jgi:dihydrolipoamide dehydrogenase